MNAPIKHAQHILAVDTSYILALTEGQTGYIPVPYEQLCANINKHLVLRRRHELEQDPEHLQILPYIVVVKGDPQDLTTAKFVVYRRGATVGEARLSGNASIGFGGHVDLQDVMSVHSVIDFEQTVSECAEREVDEEVNLNEMFHSEALQYQGLIVDHSNDVGKVHLGVVFFYQIGENVSPMINEDELTLLGELTLSQLTAAQAQGMNLESWSNLIVQQCAQRLLVQA